DDVVSTVGTDVKDYSGAGLAVSKVRAVAREEVRSGETPALPVLLLDDGVIHVLDELASRVLGLPHEEATEEVRVVVSVHRVKTLVVNESHLIHALLNGLTDGSGVHRGFSLPVASGLFSLADGSTVASSYVLRQAEKSTVAT